MFMRLSVRPGTLFAFSRPYGEPDGRRCSEDNAGLIFEERQRTRRPPDGLEKTKKVSGRALSRAVCLIAFITLPLASCGAPSSNGQPAVYDTSGQQEANPASGKHVAVNHSFTLRLQAAQIEETKRKHTGECLRLGCTVHNSYFSRDEDTVRASIEVRLPPEAYTEFAGIVSAPPAVVLNHLEKADDKTTDVLDIEKRLEAKAALRDRLSALLNDPAPKSLGDLVALERELAHVQGDIESAKAQRDYLRTITATVKVTVDYRSAGAETAAINFSPLTRAMRETGNVFISSAARVILTVIWFLPWLPVLYLVIWVIRRMIRRWRAPRAA
jgi:hypothetical protein